MQRRAVLTVLAAGAVLGLASVGAVDASAATPCLKPAKVRVQQLGARTFLVRWQPPAVSKRLPRSQRISLIRRARAGVAVRLVVDALKARGDRSL